MNCEAVPRCLFPVALCILAAATVDAQQLANASSVPAAAAPTEPRSPWGSYYMLDVTRFRKFLSDVFVQYLFSDDNPTAAEKAGGAKRCKSLTEVDYSRYYKNLKEDNMYILSYFCKVSRGYEHIVATGTPDEDGFFPDPQYVKFSLTLKDLGIFDAGRYEGEPLKGEAERQKVGSLFELVAEDVSANLPDGCANVSFRTEFQLLMKRENGLQYYKFPVSCTLDEQDDMYTDIEVFRDIDNRYVNGGKLTLAGIHGLAPNTVYHTRQEIDGIHSHTDEEIGLKSTAAESAPVIRATLLLASAAAVALI